MSLKSIIIFGLAVSPLYGMADSISCTDKKGNAILISKVEIERGADANINIPIEGTSAALRTASGIESLFLQGYGSGGSEGGDFILSIDALNKVTGKELDIKISMSWAPEQVLSVEVAQSQNANAPVINFYNCLEVQ